METWIAWVSAPFAILILWRLMARRKTPPPLEDALVGARLRTGPRDQSGAVALEEPHDDESDVL